MWQLLGSSSQPGVRRTDEGDYFAGNGTESTQESIATQAAPTGTPFYYDLGVISYKQ